MERTAKYLEIDLDKSRRLLFDLNAMAAYEKETGKNFLDVPKETISATLLRVVLWAGLIHEDKALTINQVGAMIDADNMLDIQKKIAQAASANIPEGSKEEVVDPNAQPPLI